MIYFLIIPAVFVLMSFAALALVVTCSSSATDKYDEPGAFK
jgi:hypothetical protein